MFYNKFSRTFVLHKKNWNSYTSNLHLKRMTPSLQSQPPQALIETLYEKYLCAKKRMPLYIVNSTLVINVSLWVLNNFGFSGGLMSADFWERMTRNQNWT